MNLFEKRTLKTRFKDGAVHALAGGVVGMCPASFYLLNKPEMAAFILITAIINSFIIGYVGFIDLIVSADNIREKLFKFLEK